MALRSPEPTNDSDDLLPAPLPEFGSVQHMEQLARRLSRNIRFREQVGHWTRLSLETRLQVPRRVA